MAKKRPKKRTLTVKNIISLLGGTFIEGLNYLPGQDRIRTSLIPIHSDKIPESFDGLKITFVSDLHAHAFGRRQHRLLEAVKATDPDIILAGGDWIRREFSGVDAVNIRDAAEVLMSVAPTYTIIGNHEAGALHTERVIEALDHAGIPTLRNESILLQRTNKKGYTEEIRLIGLDTPYLYYHGIDALEKQRSMHAMSRKFKTAQARCIGWVDLDPGTYPTLSSIGEQQGGRDIYRIAIGHRPELLGLYAGLGYDLVLSGHAHGGLLRLPGGKRLYAPDQGLFPMYTHGVHTTGSTTLVISEGLGGPRLGIRPELISITLTKDTGSET